MEITYEISEKLKSMLTINNSDLEISNTVQLILSEYSVTKHTTDIVLHEFSQEEKAYNMFFVAKHTEGLSNNSLKYYKVVLGNVFKNINKPFLKIETDDIRIYFAKRNMMDKVSKTTLNNERRVLSSFYSWLHEDDYIKKNPMIRIKNIKEDKIIKRPFSEEEIEIIRRNADDLRGKAIVEFLISTAVRVTEMVMLNKSEIDFQSGSCVVMGKGRKERVVYLNTKAKMTLKDYLESRNDNNEALFVGSVAPFNRFARTGVEMYLRNLGRKSGVKNIHPHRFRRTTATNALNKGMPIEQVSTLLGHAKIETTTIYARSNQDNISQSHKKFIS